MGPLALRRRVTRLSHRRAALVIALVVAGTIALHHGAIALSVEMHHGHAVVAEFCLGVLTAVGAAVAAVSIGSLRRLRWPAAFPLAPRALIKVAAAPIARARPGPFLLNLLCVSRR